ncbi:MAG: cupredoxin domain-containing protein [Candidatus Paceibacterota bacterium]|jgi:hypothetical protein
MQKKTIIWIVVVVVIAVAVVIAMKWNYYGPAPKLEEQISKPSNTAALGASAVSTSGIVITPEGKAARNDVKPMSPEAPQESLPITDKSSISQDKIDIKVSSEGISPKEFRVKANAVTNLLVSSGDQFTHLFKFQDPSLSAIAVGIGPGDPTRLITFNAPLKGEYQYLCDVPGHAGRGESGKMIVE